MSIAYRISKANRKCKFTAFLEHFRPDPTTTILDVGFAETEYSEGDNYLERHYTYLDMVTALSVDEPLTFAARYPAVKAVQYDGKEIPFPDKEFDIGWSNAVLEHVGDPTQQVAFLAEMRRTCRKLYITTPNRTFPFEVHTRIPLLHMISKPLFESAARFIGKGWATGDYMRLLSLGELRILLGEAGIDNYSIVENTFCGFTMDFCVLADCP